MILHVLATLSKLGVDHVVVVVGFQSDDVIKVIETDLPRGLRVSFAHQAVRLGSGDAAAVGLARLASDAVVTSDVLVLPGDTPLITPETLQRLIETHRAGEATATLLTAIMDNPTGYGRVVRSRDGQIARITEQVDATLIEREIKEVCTSIYCFDQVALGTSLGAISPHNNQGEFYLTDVVEEMVSRGHRVDALVVEGAGEVAGVNDLVQLASAQETLRLRINARWIGEGTAMPDPSSVFLDATVTLGQQVTLLSGVMLEGTTVVGDGAVIGPDCHLIDTEVGECATLHSVEADRAKIGRGAVVGPSCVLAPGSVIGDEENTGPFFSSPTSL
jgi:bifunctional UDP-N-acetylglucosamine pyrophosphorylase/glucosamine-1-phosphate N-acetyltransferase